MHSGNIKLSLFIFIFTLVTAQTSFSASKEYSFSDAQAYFEKKHSDLASYQKKLENNEINSINDVVDTRELRRTTIDYITYKLVLERKIAQSINNRKKLENYCSNYISLGTSEENYINKLDEYNKKIAEKFITPEMYTPPTDEELHKAVVDYLIKFNIIYEFRDPDSIKIKLDDIIPYKSDNNHIGFIYIGHYNAKNGFGSYTGYTPVRLVYVDGELIEFDQPSDIYDHRILKICNRK